MKGGSKAILAGLRQGEGEQILALHNLGDRPEAFTAPLVAETARGTDLLTGASFDMQNGQLSITLQPYQYLWLSLPGRAAGD